MSDETTLAKQRLDHMPVRYFSITPNVAYFSAAMHRIPHKGAEKAFEIIKQLT